MKVIYSEFVKEAQLTVKDIDKSKIIIYSLTDPNTNLIRYVGKTKVIKFGYRMWQHFHNSKNHVGHWTQQLIRNNQLFTWEILDIVDESDWPFWEIFWISLMKSWNQPLTNLTSGGDGVPITEEIRKKMSDGQKRRAARGEFKNPEYRKKISDSLRKTFNEKKENGNSHKHTDEYKKRLSKIIKEYSSKLDSYCKDPKFAEARSKNTSKGWETRRNRKNF